MHFLPNLIGALLLVSATSAASLDRRAVITATTTRTVMAYVTETVYIYANNKGQQVTTTVPYVAKPTATAPTSLVLVVKPTPTTSSMVTSTRAPTSSTSVRSSSSSAARTSSSAAAAVPTKGASGTDSDRPLVAAYYPDWVESQLSPEQINWSKLDWIDFAFAVLDSNLNLVFTGWNSDDLLRRTVRLGHAAGKKIKLSIGGWTGSAYFSTAVSTEWHREDLANKMLAMYNQYNLDGLDIDWEYPASGGIDSNRRSPNDSKNYLAFLRVLRQKLPAGAKLTAATQVWPFSGDDSRGSPLTDVTGFAEVFDWITIMNYDVWGSTTLEENMPGPNAPLYDGCKNSRQPLANADEAVKSWNAAGFPLKKIMLGTAFYGYISRSDSTKLYTKRSGSYDLSNSVAKRSWGSRLASDDLATTNTHNELEKRAVTVKNEGGGSNDGQIMFVDLIRQGALGWDNNQRKWVGANGFTRMWDGCSSTPFLRSPEVRQVVTYDDPDSLSLKGQFARQRGLGGVGSWDLHGDNQAWDLLTALRSGLGI